MKISSGRNFNGSITRTNDYSQSGTDAEFRSPVNTFSDLSLYPRYPITDRHNSKEDGDLLHVSHLMNSLRYLYNDISK